VRRRRRWHPSRIDIARRRANDDDDGTNALPPAWTIVEEQQQRERRMTRIDGRTVDGRREIMMLGARVGWRGKVIRYPHHHN
jgi:hypothetical protein